MSKFKVGDIVKCVDSSFIEDGLKYGKEYTVADVRDYAVIYVSSYEKSQGYFSDRFELVEQKTTVSDIVSKVKEHLPEALTPMFSFSLKLCNQSNGTNMQVDKHAASREEIENIVRQMFELSEGV